VPWADGAVLTVAATPEWAAAVDRGERFLRRQRWTLLGPDDGAPFTRADWAALAAYALDQAGADSVDEMLSLAGNET
jgi:hypothetical protein